MPLGQYTRMFSQSVRKTVECFVAHDVEKKFNTLYNITVGNFLLQMHISPIGSH